MLSLMLATPALRVPTPMMQMAAPSVDAGILLQGNSLRTWSYASQALEQVQVVLSNEGRPIDAEVELWQGPGNVPFKMRVYLDRVCIKHPRGRCQWFTWLPLAPPVSLSIVCSVHTLCIHHARYGQ